MWALLLNSWQKETACRCSFGFVMVLQRTPDRSSRCGIVRGGNCVCLRDRYLEMGSIFWWTSSRQRLSESSTRWDVSRVDFDFRICCLRVYFGNATASTIIACRRGLPWAGAGRRQRCGNAFAPVLDTWKAQPKGGTFLVALQFMQGYVYSCPYCRLVGNDV